MREVSCTCKSYAIYVLGYYTCYACGKKTRQDARAAEMQNGRRISRISAKAPQAAHGRRPPSAHCRLLLAFFSLKQKPTRQARTGHCGVASRRPALCAKSRLAFRIATVNQSVLLTAADQSTVSGSVFADTGNCQANSLADG